MTEEEKEALEILNNTEWDGFMITIKNLIKKQESEINKLKSVIDRMAEQLAGLAIWDNNKKEPLILTDVAEVKEYFMKEDKQYGRTRNKK